MRYIAVIPARINSKGIRKKVLTHCLSKPLISYTIDAAIQSKQIDEVYCCTDSNEIADYVADFGIETNNLRPKHLSDDHTPMLDVLSFAIENYSIDVSDYIVLLQPTSPLRSATQIDQAIAYFKESRPGSLVSITKIPHQYSPISALNFDPTTKFISKHLPTAKNILRRQDKPIVYARNGPSILITTPLLINSGTLYGEANYGFIMDAMSSVDIDTHEDLSLCEAILLSKKYGSML